MVGSCDGHVSRRDLALIRRRPCGIILFDLSREVARAPLFEESMLYTKGDIGQFRNV